MTEMQEAIYQVEAFLSENYQFRRNLLSGKTEVAPWPGTEWIPVTVEALNSIVRHAKKEGVGGDRSPKQNIEEYVNSDAVPNYDPIREYLEGLPRWDGRNHVSELFGRLPGLNTEQLAWCSTWMRSMVAHWLGMDTLHGNECVPVLIGSQGCGKSTFAVRLLPPHLRTYFLDHINFGNKFDSEMALTHNLLVNIDEFANMGPSQQGKLKQTLSKVKVNGRPIFGRAQEDRRRYASFLATTNDSHPLCDPTGSRRFLCIRISKGMLIDNESPINYPQLYAQVVHELQVEKIPYWFSNDEVIRIQAANLPYFRTDDMENILRQCYRLPDEGEEGVWYSCSQVFDTLIRVYPNLGRGNALKIKIGQTLKYLGCQQKHTRNGAVYKLIDMAA
ncbi:MAG: DUF3874 domain-containing protein [Bacteroidales bacterium]|nr:DUF3874 domain-containing protein [Bacteroidales bacterium]